MSHTQLKDLIPFFFFSSIKADEWKTINSDGDATQNKTKQTKNETEKLICRFLIATIIHIYFFSSFFFVLFCFYFRWIRTSNERKTVLSCLIPFSMLLLLLFCSHRFFRSISLCRSACVFSLILFAIWL